MACEDVECLVSLLADRYALLASLADRGRTKSELVEALDVSRSTVDRAVRSLEENGLLSRDGSHVSLTPFGRIAFDGYTSFRDGLQSLDRARPMLSASGNGTPSIPFAFFADADVVAASRGSPHRPVVAFEQFLEDVESIESIVTGILPEYVRSYNEQALGGDLEAELVVEASVLDDLIATYWEPIEEAVETGRLRIYETEESPAASVKVAEGETTEAALLVYGPQGISGFVRTTSPEGIAWARSILEEVRANATRIAPLAEEQVAADRD